MDMLPFHCQQYGQDMQGVSQSIACHWCMYDGQGVYNIYYISLFHLWKVF
jgi:hypothetical protein